MSRARSVRFVLVCAVSAALSPCAGCKSEAHPPPPVASASEARVPAAAPSSVRFQSAPVTVGQKTDGRRSTSLKLSVEFWQDGEKLGTNDSSRAEAYSRTVRVVGTLGSAPARELVHYSDYHFADVRSDQPPREEAILKGKSYLLDASATGQPMATLTPEGKPIPDAERTALVPLHLDLGKDDPVVTALGTAPIAVGKRRPLSENLFRALASTPRGEGDFKSGTITLSKVGEASGRSSATLDWTAEMKKDGDNGLETTWRLTGKTVVAIAPAQTLSNSISASIDASGHTTQNGAKVDLAGAGTLTDERTETPWTEVSRPANAIP